MKTIAEIEKEFVKCVDLPVTSFIWKFFSTHLEERDTTIVEAENNNHDLTTMIADLQAKLEEAEKRSKTIHQSVIEASVVGKEAPFDSVPEMLVSGLKAKLTEATALLEKAELLLERFADPRYVGIAIGDQESAKQVLTEIRQNKK